MATSRKLGPFGGPKGHNSWDDGANTNIRQLNITSGVVIDAIQVRYDKNGKDVWTGKNGGPGGNTHEIKFDFPNEYIISISGYHSGHSNKDFIEVVQSLKIKTNKDTYGPFGTEEGQTFTIEASNEKIVGFFGRFGWYVNSIGAYTAPVYQTVGPFGGEGGSLWDDGVFTTIRQVEIYHGDIIDSIRVEYDNNGTSVWKEKHGESLGGQKEPIELEYPKEYIISVSGHQRKYGVGNIISSLKIQTNKKTWGPYGREEGEPFKFPTSNGKIVGFHGKSGSYIDAIGAHFVPVTQTPNHEFLGPYGGHGGSIWDDGVKTGIKQIEIAIDGEIITSIRTQYENNGDSIWSEKRGESNNGSIVQVKLDHPEEYITSITGYYRDYIKEEYNGFIVSSIKIQTNKKTWGSYGKEQGTPFSIIPKYGSKIVGFHGKSSTYIDSLGAYAVSIS